MAKVASWDKKFCIVSGVQLLVDDRELQIGVHILQFIKLLYEIFEKKHRLKFVKCH